MTRLLRDIVERFGVIWLVILIAVVFWGAEQCIGAWTRRHEYEMARCETVCHGHVARFSLDNREQPVCECRQ